MNTLAVRVLFVCLLIFVCWAFYFESSIAPNDSVEQQIERPYVESYLRLDNQWLFWLEQSQSEPRSALQQLKLIDFSNQKLSVLESAYLYAILSNISATVTDAWLQERINAIPNAIKQLEWVELFLESEDAVRIWYSGDKSAALMKAQEIVVKAEQRQLWFLMPRLLNSAGGMALSENELLQAQKYLLKSAHYSELQNDKLYQSRSYYNMSKTYFFMNQWEQALDFMQKARKLHESLPNPRPSKLQLYWYNESVILGNLGLVDEAIHAQQQASHYFSLVQKTARNQVLDIRVKVNVAVLQRDFLRARTLIEQCVLEASQANLSYSLGRCYLKLAYIDYQLMEYDVAIDSIEKSIMYFQRYQSKHSVVTAMKFKALIFEAKGDYVTAYRLMKQSFLQEKEQLLKKLRDLTHAQEVFDMAKQRDVLSRQNRLANHALNQKVLYLDIAKWLGLFALVSIVILFVRTWFVARENAQLAHFSSTDMLTGLYNRQYYYQQLAKGNKISQQARYHVIMMDIDHFKAINDSYGHLVGDEILKLFAKRVLDGVQTEELFVRWGGEEFLLLIKANSNVKQRVEAIRVKVATEKFDTSAGALTVTASIGVGEPALPQTLLADERYFIKADQNLYIAKQNGRNQVVSE